MANLLKEFAHVMPKINVFGIEGVIVRLFSMLSRNLYSFFAKTGLTKPKIPIKTKKSHSKNSIPTFSNWEIPVCTLGNFDPIKGHVL